MKRALALFLLVGCSSRSIPLPETPKGPAVQVPKGDPVPAGAFTTTDGRKGWKVKLPGQRILATPAVSGDLVLVGGGFGSHEFYAFDARTGKVVWEYKTADDGPTAAVVEGDYVAFNTESCEIEVLNVRTGKPVWKKWLGDPLMSMPAIADGRIYQAFPDSRGDRHHYLACLDLQDGREYWRKKIAGEVITAPVVDGGHVLAACLEGTLFTFRAGDGRLVHSEKKNATSSPCVWNGNVYTSNREEGGRPVETQLCVTVTGGSVWANGRQDAEYLDAKKKEGLQSERGKMAADEGVGFASSKGDAKMEQAERNLGEKTVCGVWAYQGSKPFVVGGRIYCAMGANVKCLEAGDGKIVWERPVKRGDLPVAERALTPPAIVNGKLFFGTVTGEVLVLDAATGDLLWTVNVGEPVVFQPAVAGGRVFVGTASGGLVMIETGDAKDDGWRMWGATARHNGI
jgi:Ca-activated chloride channel family protein